MPYTWYREFLEGGLNLMIGLSGGEFKTETPSEKYDRMRATVAQLREQGILSW